MAAQYKIPRYRAPEGVSFYHVLHGNVPDHQIDFIYCPEVPQGTLTQTHFSHIARLMRYIEPQASASHAFAIGNLSRDDTQHEPGHGALGIIVGMRVTGAVDHAGRQNPPFAHGIIAVDRDLTVGTLLEAAGAFHRHMVGGGEARSPAQRFYREYLRAAPEGPERAAEVLRRYVADFRDLPCTRQSRLGWDFSAGEEARGERVVIVHRDGEAFDTIAHAASRIAAVLYRSNIRWTSITTGRETDIPGGVSIRFVEGRNLTAEERRGALWRLEDIGDDEREIARALFAARPHEGEPKQYAGWRARMATDAEGPEDEELTRPIALPEATSNRAPWASGGKDSAGGAPGAESGGELEQTTRTVKPGSERGVRVWMGVALGGVAASAVAGWLVASRGEAVARARVIDAIAEIEVNAGGGVGTGGMGMAQGSAPPAEPIRDEASGPAMTAPPPRLPAPAASGTSHAWRPPRSRPAAPRPGVLQKKAAPQAREKCDIFEGELCGRTKRLSSSQGDDKAP